MVKLRRLMFRRYIETYSGGKALQNYVRLLLESRDTFKHLTVLRDASTLGTVGARSDSRFPVKRANPSKGGDAKPPV
jgi:hypothetical protein